MLRPLFSLPLHQQQHANHHSKGRQGPRKCFLPVPLEWRVFPDLSTSGTHNCTPCIRGFSVHCLWAWSFPSCGDWWGSKVQKPKGFHVCLSLPPPLVPAPPAGLNIGLCARFTPEPMLGTPGKDPASEGAFSFVQAPPAIHNTDLLCHTWPRKVPLTF